MIAAKSATVRSSGLPRFITCEQWKRITITAEDCPRISPAFLDEERQALGPLFFASEYRCEFVDTVDQVFSHETVMGALSATVTPLFGSET